MVYDSTFRETTAAMAAIDTAYPMGAKGADTPGPFVVPTTVSKVTGIRICLASLGQDVYTGTTSAVHLFGSGIKLGEGYFPGPMLAQNGAAATSGPLSQLDGMYYKTNIPVTPGGQFSAEAFIHGEDPISAHMGVEIEYDGFPGRIIDCDYREETVGAAANTLTRLGVRGAGVAEPDFSPVSTIGEVIFGQIIDPDGHATDSFNIAPACVLTGNGLLLRGDYEFLGAWGIAGPDLDIAGPGSIMLNPSRKVTGPGGIPIKTGGLIRAAAQNIESLSESHAIVGLAYI